MNPAIRESSRRADAAIRGACILALAYVSATLVPVGIAHAEPPQGTIVAWGSNDNGQRNVPAPNADFIGIAAGAWHSLGLKANGSAVAWGYNDFGQASVPAPNTGLVAVAAGNSHSLALKADGSIVGWGCGAPYNKGQCNDPAPNTGFLAIAAGGYHNLGLKADGSIVAWGLNDYGQTDIPAPNTGFIAVAASLWYSLGLKSDGSIVVWGDGSLGQLNLPVPNSGFVGVAAGGYHSLGLKGGAACCLNSGTCLQLVSQSQCDAQSGVFHGLGSSCGGDLDGDSIADTCDQCPYDPTNTKTPEGQCIPTVSQWGLLVTAGLVAGRGREHPA